MARTTEEQITQLKNCVLGWQPALSPSARQALAAIAKAYIEEAEQRGYERAQAECADDTKRMDDMEEILKTHELGRTFEGFAFSKGYLRIAEGKSLRSAIDAAMKEGEL